MFKVVYLCKKKKNIRINPTVPTREAHESRIMKNVLNLKIKLKVLMTNNVFAIIGKTLKIINRFKQWIR